MVRPGGAGSAFLRSAVSENREGREPGGLGAPTVSMSSSTSSGPLELADRRLSSSPTLYKGFVTSSVRTSSVNSLQRAASE